MYRGHEFAEQVNELPKDGISYLRVYPLWWALVLGCVFLLFGLLSWFDAINVLPYEEWAKKYDLIDWFERFKLRRKRKV